MMGARPGILMAAPIVFPAPRRFRLPGHDREHCLRRRWKVHRNRSGAGYRRRGRDQDTIVESFDRTTVWLDLFGIADVDRVANTY